MNREPKSRPPSTSELRAKMSKIKGPNQTMRKGGRKR
jgi:hypothetical protein